MFFEIPGKARAVIITGCICQQIQIPVCIEKKMFNMLNSGLFGIFIDGHTEQGFKGELDGMGIAHTKPGEFRNPRRVI
jgi:hypothetical protein